MRHLIRNAFPYSLIFFVVIILLFTNYTPGTWLSGWDNLHPEFNFKTNIVDRLIWSTWQEYQGLGVRAGNAHAADLIRQLGLFLLSFLFPLSSLRYFYHFFALFIGGIGAYELIRRITLRDKPYWIQQTGATIGALFYILNLGTMQYFAVPYEAFSHFFASLPWLLLTLFLYLKNPKRYTLFFFALTSLCAIPMNYIPTIFVVWAIMIGIIGSVDIFNRMRNQTKTLSPIRRLWNALKPSLCIIIVTICINAYWLFPFAAFVRNGTGFVAETKINRMFTQEAFLRNQQFGTLADVAMLKGFLFNTTDLVDTKDTHDFIMKPWITYLSQPLVRYLFYSLFLCICMGYAIALLTKRPHSVPFVLLFFLSLGALFTTNPPTGPLFTFLQKHLPLFQQVFRFPFTKILPVAVLSYAIGLSYFLSFIIQKFHRIPKNIFLGISITLLIVTQIPSFTGHFIYSPMRVVIPQEYFDVFQYLKTQDPHGRIANLPQATFWGWTAYDWGYRGSGFPWYGIRQPLLDRAFDVWNQTNEQYYRDLTLALYATDSPQSLEEVFTRYGVTYIWLDERVIYPANPRVLLLEETKKRLTSLSSIETVFIAGKQTIYRYNDVHPSVRLSSEKESVIYPFEGLKNGKEISSLQTNEKESIFSTPISTGVLTLPSFFHTDQPILTRITNQESGLLFQPLIPTIQLNTQSIPMPSRDLTISLGTQRFGLMQINNTLMLQSEKNTIALLSEKNTVRLYTDTPSQSTDITKAFLTKPIHNCSAYATTNESVYGKEDSAFSTIFFGKMSKLCIYAPLQELIDQTNYTVNPSIIHVRFSYKTDGEASPTFCFSKKGEQSCLYQKTLKKPILKNVWTEEDIYVPLVNNPLSDIWIKIEMNTERAQTLERLEIQNLQLQTLPPPLKEITFDMPVAPDITLTVDQPSTLTITVPHIQSVTTETIPFTDTKQARNCYTLGSGTFSKSIITEPNIGVFARYSSRDASSCDWKEIQTSFLSSGAILSLSTRNINGRPLKICLKTDPPGYCVLEDILQEKNHMWSTSSFVIPAITTKYVNKNYLEFDNLAVGNEERINDVGPITMTSIPYAWLSAITLEPIQPVDSLPQDNSLYSNLTVDHPNPVYYKISLQPSAISNQTNTTLILSQSFDEGWRAYTIQNSESKIQNWLQTTFPFIFGKEIEEHVMVNNWENAWRLPEAGMSNATNATNTTNEKVTIVLFFVPQLLQWIGFALLPIPFLILLLKK